MSTVAPYKMVESARPFLSFSRTPSMPRCPTSFHCPQTRIGTGRLFFADSGPDGGQCQRFPAEPAHIQMWLTLPDAAAAHSRAVAGGATSVMEVTDQGDGSRMGGFVAFGALWWVSTPA
jgi:PhnB protein